MGNCLDWLNFWVTLISSLATVGTAFVAYITIKEMKKQREHSYIPNFALNPSTALWIYLQNEDNVLKNVSWTDKVRSPIDQTPIPKGFEIDLYNIGNGVAKNVKFEYSLEDVNNGVYINLLSSVPDYDKNIPEMTIEMFRNPSKHHDDLSYDANFFSVFINKTEEPYKVSLPNFYLSFNNYLIFSCLQSKVDHLSTKLAPVLKLKISYQDIALNKFSQTFNMAITFFGNSDNGYHKVVMGELIVEEASKDPIKLRPRL